MIHGLWRIKELSFFFHITITLQYKLGTTKNQMLGEYIYQRLRGVVSRRPSSGTTVVVPVPTGLVLFWR